MRVPATVGVRVCVKRGSIFPFPSVGGEGDCSSRDNDVVIESHWRHASLSRRTHSTDLRKDPAGTSQSKLRFLDEMETILHLAEHTEFTLGMTMFLVQSRGARSTQSQSNTAHRHRVIQWAPSPDKAGPEFC